MQDIEKLTKWVIKSNLDPNDPRNADLINLIKVRLGGPATFTVDNRQEGVL
jgi:hypothetical protein